MKIVVAPDSFKESLSAEDVANAIRRGLLRVDSSLEVVCVPVADGGEGTTQALIAATGGALHTEETQDPLGRPISASWGLLGGDSSTKTAVIETASASGLDRLTRQERDPYTASSWGTGQLIKAALDSGARCIILGLGGSATNDGGAGLLSALGARFLDKTGQDLPPGGLALAQLDQVDLSGLDPRIKETEFRVACDVDNPLLGERGASAIFGPQKGASPEQVQALDAALTVFADRLEHATQRATREQAGAGAAGGLGFGLVQCCNASLAPGIELVLDALDFESTLSGASLVITGEGRADGQSLSGKTPVGVARRAKQLDLPVVALCGAMGDRIVELHSVGIDAVFSVLSAPQTLDEALAGAADNLEQSAEQLFRALQIRLE